MKLFEDDEAKARYQTLKGKQTLPEKGFVFKGTGQEAFPENVMATIAMHKWEKFAAHPSPADPKKKPINVSIVQEFYAHLTSPIQSAVFVRGEQIQFTAAKVNKFYGLQNTADSHSKFVSVLKGKNNDFLLEDLCFPGVEWDSANTTVERDRLKPEVDEAYACLSRKSSPLLFPHPITTLCQKKGVLESLKDLQRKGRLGISPENIQNLMGYDEAATAKQPTRGPKTIVAARLAALTTMAETMRAQLEEVRTDLRIYFQYVQERDQVIREDFMEMMPQSPLEFPLSLKLY
ncbi:hypothetical protein V6N12_067165 [Hibiscus sabdariffa]|uniref:Uncharacterized protein n=1 Tax=Hibiscus sabdariffa TaxID=183260 RepID=A0ABR2BVN5_9ROSI